MARKLTESDVEFIVECLPEDIPVCGNALASGNDAEDTRAENRILAELEAGNQWAWCTVRVVCRWGKLETDAYLGCCSYDDEHEFRTGGYFADMMTETLAALQAEIDELAAQICV